MSAAQRASNWIGVVLALACLTVVLTGNTAMVWRFEHVSVPLSWVLAGAAILAFIATEICDSASPLPSEAEDSSEHIYDWEAVELSN